MLQQDILTHIGRQMIMANELRGTFKNVPYRRDKGATQITDSGQWNAPLSAYLLEYLFNLDMVL